MAKSRSKRRRSRSKRRKQEAKLIPWIIGAIVVVIVVGMLWNRSFFGLFSAKVEARGFEEFMGVTGTSYDAGETMHRLGESCCQSIWKKHKDTFLGNVKAFLAAATGYPPTEIEEKHILQIIDDDQPLCGTVLEVKNRVILTKAKTPFTKINWKREVPPAELLTILPAEAQEMFFPDGTLEKMAAADAAA